MKAKPAVESLQMSPQKFIEAAMASKLFKDTADVAQAYVKITLGASLGLDPVTSMASIYLVSGKPSMSANLMAARVKQSGRYRYEVLEKSAKQCRLQFYELLEEWSDGKVTKKWVKPGPEEVYSVEMAAKANLTKNPVWQNHPANMCFARAMSNGVKAYAPDLMMGVPIYTPDELDPNMRMSVTADGEVVPDAEYVTAAPAGPDRVGEIRALMADTKTDEKEYLNLLCRKDSADRLTASEQDKVIGMLKSKKNAQPF